MLRRYEHPRDCEAVHRIWLEVGWIIKDEKPVIEEYLAWADSMVAEIDGEAECLASTVPSNVLHSGTELPTCCVTAVTTSHVARRQGLAGRTTAMAIAERVARGDVLATLGMFEQGYYDKLGFGTGTYERIMEFDPASLRLPDGIRARPPQRVALDDCEAIHASRLSRLRCHGAVSIIDSRWTRTELQRQSGGEHVGLGYRDGPNGELTHMIWMYARDREFGPYRIRWMTYRTHEQFMELMALLHALADQFHQIRMNEPAGIQLQDLIELPMRRLRVTRDSKMEQKFWSLAYWQMRMCDVPACVAAVGLPWGDARFNLVLTDPIERYLPEDAPWRGVAGEYVVSLGASSGAERGRDDSLPTMHASVNAFTRLWLGVRSATTLAVTDRIDAPAELLARLDDVLRLPEPHVDWDY